MAEDYAAKAEALSKKAYQQSIDCNDAGNILEPSDRVQNMDQVNAKEAAEESDNDGDGD